MIQLLFIILLSFSLICFGHNHIKDDDDEDSNVVAGGVSFFLDRTFELRWKFLKDRQVATFSVRTSVGGWFAIGFSNSSQMPKTDVVAFIECERAEFDDQEQHKHIDRHFNEATPAPADKPLCISDRWATKYDTPPSDFNLGGQKQSYELISDQSAIIPDKHSILTVQFGRSFENKDYYDFQFTPDFLKRGNATGFYAFAAFNDKTTDFDKKHTRASKKLVTLFSTIESDQTSPKTPNELRPHLVHGTIMLICWVLLSVCAIFTSRYLKPLGDLWFRAHTTLAFAITVGSFIAFYVIFQHYIEIEASHFDNIHAKIGLIVLILLVLQLICGYLAHTKWNPARTFTPLWPDRIHWYIGRITLIVAFFACLLGINQAGGGIGFKSWTGSLAIVLLGLSLALFIIADSRYVTAKRRGEEEHAVALIMKKFLIAWMVLAGTLVIIIVFLLDKA